MSTRNLVRHIHTLGTIRGALEGAEGKVVAFRGVPYAAPPVGPLRFAPSQPAIPWQGVRDATANGPIAPQTALRVDRAMGPITAAQGEDCLTLTVWTSADAGAKAPVMVWLHGGGFITGAGSLPWYDGGNLAARHGVVVVCVNYRLGALGFLPVPSRLPGNLGLLDQIAALRWVQRHIEVFGGDPARVTVMGQSGGAHNIASMLAISDTEGLFHRAILQSPPLAIGLMTSGEAARRGGVFLKQLGIDPDQPDLVDSLRALTVPDLLAAQVKAMVALGAAQKGDLRPPFLPAEGAPHDFPSPELVERAAANAAARGVDVLIGWTHDEANLYVAANPALAAISEAELESAAAAMVGFSAATMIVAARAARPGAPPGQIFLDLMTETTFAAPCKALARAIARAGGRAFLYRFDWQSPSAALGACHCLDIPFALGTWRAWMNAPIMAGANEAAVEDLSAEMMRRWAGFATTGDPGFAPACGDALPIMVFDRERDSRHRWEPMRHEPRHGDKNIAGRM
ncbi:MAG TPA: carboxylesterase family protein [Pseudolabrys sp.]